jgi:hypothetical protein
VSSSTPVQSLRLCPQMQAPPPLTPPAAHSQLRWRTHCLTVPPSIDESQPSLQPTSSIPRPKKLTRVPRRRRHKPQNPNSIGGPTTPSPPRTVLIPGSATGSTPLPPLHLATARRTQKHVRTRTPRMGRKMKSPWARPQPIARYRFPIKQSVRMLTNATYRLARA